MWRETQGIFQSDYEGFSNEEGDHILWQFHSNAEDFWQMAVLDAVGNWKSFKMDLADKDQRKEFKEGKVPKGVEED